MVFTLAEIKNYLTSKLSINDAIKNLSEEAIVSCITDSDSLNFERNEENLEKYETKIGMSRIKEEQKTIRRNSNGSKGKYWMALSPKWIDNENWKKRLKTKFEIAYWVNYGDDEVYGWFSVEQIKKWLTTPDLKLHTLGGTRSRVV